MTRLKRWTTTLAAAAAASVITLAPAMAQRFDDHMGEWGWGWGHMIFGSLFMLLFWAAIIVGIVVVIRWLVGAGHTAAGSPRFDAALDILRERFARGEIDKEEYDERKRHLSQR